jgi:uncharacterized protein YjbI with pentapeptide repeats
MPNWVRAAAAAVRRSKNVKAVLSTAELLGKLTIVFGILSFIVEGPERAKQRHYQAWQLIDGARGHPGDAGRSIAIGVLVKDHEEIRELDLANANLKGRDLRSAMMPGVNFRDAKLDGANFSCIAGLYLSEYWLPRYSPCWVTNLEEAGFQTDLTKIHFDHTDLKDAVLGGHAIQQKSNFTSLFCSTFNEAHMEGAVIRNTVLVDNIFNQAKMHGSQWQESIIGSNNSFVGADLSSARWFGVDFRLAEGQKPSDFTDANLSGIQVSEDAAVPSQLHELSEDEKLLQKAILCRTKFSKSVSNRDCDRRDAAAPDRGAEHPFWTLKAWMGATHRDESPCPESG